MVGNELKSFKSVSRNSLRNLGRSNHGRSYQSRVNLGCRFQYERSKQDHTRRLQHSGIRLFRIFGAQTMPFSRGLCLRAILLIFVFFQIQTVLAKSSRTVVSVGELSVKEIEEEIQVSSANFFILGHKCLPACHLQHGRFFNWLYLRLSCPAPSPFKSLPIN